MAATFLPSALILHHSLMHKEKEPWRTIDAKALAGSVTGVDVGGGGDETQQRKPPQLRCRR
jgi:hypothetical protein